MMEKQANVTGKLPNESSESDIDAQGSLSCGRGAMEEGQ